MSQELLNIFMAVFYIAAIVFMVLFVSWLKIQRRKNSEAMRKNIISKFSSEIALTAKDVVHIGKAFDLSAHQARKVIYDIYSEVNEKHPNVPPMFKVGFSRSFLEPKAGVDFNHIQHYWGLIAKKYSGDGNFQKSTRKE